MRRRLVRNTVLVSAMVLAVLATPVIVLITQISVDAFRQPLHTQAEAIAILFRPQLESGTAIDSEDLESLFPRSHVEIVGSTGQTLVVAGPDRTSDDFTEKAPGANNTTIVVSGGAEDKRTLTRSYILFGVLAAGGLLLAGVLAAIFGARVSNPLEQLASSAGRLGAGDFSVTLPPPSGIREIDDISSSLSASATRLDQTLSAERSFTGDATHQLRTGLTGIALQLQLLARNKDESVRADAAQALAQTERLTATLDELLDLARGGRGSQRVSVQLNEIALEHRGDWLQRFQMFRRGVICHGDGLPVRATPGFVGQIIDILLDNSLRHGRGSVHIEVSGRQLQLADEGCIDALVADALFTGADDPAAPHGRGLSLARRLAQADGGSLELVSRDPTTFLLTLPAAHHL